MTDRGAREANDAMFKRYLIAKLDRIIDLLERAVVLPEDTDEERLQP